MLRTLIAYIMDWLFGKAVEMYRQYKINKARNEGIDAETKKQAEQLKHSETDKEDIDAAKDILSRRK